MISRLRFPGNSSNASNGNGNGAASNTNASIFSSIGLTTSSLSLTGSNSLLSSSADRAAASATAGISGDELPSGWRLVGSRHSGKEYYLHIASGHTQWEKPTEAEPKRTDGSSNQKVASVFSVARMGMNIQSMFNQANSRLQTTLQSTTTGTQGGKSAFQPRSSQEIDRDGQSLVEIYENERLEGKLLPQDPKKFSDRHAATGLGYDVMPEGDLPEGHEWVTEWEIDQNYTAVDREGWTYAADFVEIVRLLQDDLSHASRHPTDAVRRRRWIRYRQPVGYIPPQSPTESKDQGSSVSSSTWATESGSNHLSESSHYNDMDENDDPFQRTAQKTQTGFRVNVNFAHRRGKDNTKDYQSINLSDVMWLVTAHDVTNAPADELMREKTANLEERIKEATVRSKNLEKTLRVQHDKQSKELAEQQKKLEQLIAQYKKIQLENETLQLSVASHRSKVEGLRKEATEKDILANEEQRALNAETSAANQALEEKAKALATARMRYKRDNKQLAAALEDAKKRLEQHKSKANADSQDPVAKELKTEMDKVRKLHAKLEAVRQHRLAVEEESKALFNQVVEKKADLKFKSKKKMETALKEVDAKIKALKEEQAALSKSLAQRPEGEELRKLNARRSDIRSELGALKERRTMLLAEKRKHEGVEL